jgi:hypothetical protein
VLASAMGPEQAVGAVQLSARLWGVSPPVTRGGWQFGDPARAIELALAGGGVDIPMAAFAFEINETFQYQYNLLTPGRLTAGSNPDTSSRRRSRSRAEVHDILATDACGYRKSTRLILALKSFVPSS